MFLLIDLAKLHKILFIPSVQLYLKYNLHIFLVILQSCIDGGSPAVDENFAFLDCVLQGRKIFRPCVIQYSGVGYVIVIADFIL